MANELEQDDQIGQLAELFVEQYRRGENPTVGDYMLRYPEYADRISRLFPTLVLMEELSPEPEEIETNRSSTAPPRRLGDYEILEEIGRGGMGVVYRAKQISLNREVALKILTKPLGIQSQNLHRFRLEAQAAGQLHHPNIVPVIDVGEQDGLHYYGMQLIHGHNLDVILSELRRQSTIPKQPCPSTTNESASNKTTDNGLDSLAQTTWSAARIPKSDHPDYFRRIAEIGTRLAESLEFAHRAGILHRDVKPSNILVDRTGHVWVTDFGLAKTLENGADSTTEVTRTGDVIGTIQYMAPERFRGWSDPRSDVYSLGMTLYEMLTLRQAFVDRDRLNLMEQVRNRDPIAPRTLNSRIPKNLETIVLKSIEKDASLRYVSAADLASDLRRFHEGRPILARRSSLRERGWQICRRNPLASVLTCLLVTFIFAAWIGMLYLWRAAVASDKDAREHLAAEHRNLNLAVAAVEEFSTKVSGDPRLKEHDLRPLRLSLLKTAATFHQSLTKLREGTEEGRIDLARSYRGLANLTAQIESPERTFKLYEHAIKAFDDVLRVSPDNRTIQVELAGTLSEFALQMQIQGRSNEGEPMLDRGIEILQSLTTTDKTNTKTASELASLLDHKALFLRNRKLFDEANTITTESLAIWDELRSRYPNDIELAARVAKAHYNAGNGHLVRGLKWWREAELELETAWSILQPLLNGENQSFVDPSFVLTLLARRADPAKVSGRPDEALNRNRETLRMGRELVQRNPSVLSLQHSLALSLHQLADIELLSGNDEAARIAYQEAADILERLVRLAPGNVLWEGGLANVLATVAEVYIQRGNTESALNNLDRAICLFEAILQREPGRPLTERQLASTLSDRGRLRIRLKQFELAEPDLARAVLLEESPMRENYRINHAWSLIHLGKYREAVAITRAALESISGHSPNQSFGSYAITGAKTYAVAFTLAQDDQSVSAVERGALTKEYGDAACDLLQKILESNPKSAADLRNCEEFEPLRKQLVFKGLIQQ